MKAKTPTTDEMPPTCPLCKREFEQRSALVWHVTVKVVRSWLRWLPRRIGLIILPGHDSQNPLEDGTTPIGFLSTRRRKIYYGKQYRQLHYWGRIAGHVPKFHWRLIKEAFVVKKKFQGFASDDN